MRGRFSGSGARKAPVFSGACKCEGLPEGPPARRNRCPPRSERPGPAAEPPSARPTPQHGRAWRSRGRGAPASASSDGLGWGRALEAAQDAAQGERALLGRRSMPLAAAGDLARQPGRRTGCSLQQSMPSSGAGGSSPQPCIAAPCGAGRRLELAAGGVAHADGCAAAAGRAAAMCTARRLPRRSGGRGAPRRGVPPQAAAAACRG